MAGPGYAQSLVGGRLAQVQNRKAGSAVRQIENSESDAWENETEIEILTCDGISI